MRKLIIVLLMGILITGILLVGLQRYFERPIRPTFIPTSPSRKKGTLYIGIMVHLEGWDEEVVNEEVFKKHADVARKFASVIEKYGAKATFEASPEFIEACKRWNDNVLRELFERGHGLGVHADLGGAVEKEGLTQESFASKLAEMKRAIESLTGIKIRHVSGICSTLDWVRAAADAGYEFTTGTVAYCVMSMPENERPAEFRNCPSPAACHDTFPVNQKDRMHPWRTSTGRNWLEVNPNGRLVILPASGVLKGMKEEMEGKLGVGGEDKFTEEDIDTYIDLLEEALSYAEADKVNIFYLGWSIGSPNIKEDLLEKWLDAIQPYVKAGKVEWKTLPEMYEAFIQWEASKQVGLVQSQTSNQESGESYPLLIVHCGPIMTKDKFVHTKISPSHKFSMLSCQCPHYTKN